MGGSLVSFHSIVHNIELGGAVFFKNFRFQLGKFIEIHEVNKNIFFQKYTILKSEISIPVEFMRFNNFFNFFSLFLREDLENALTTGI